MLSKDVRNDTWDYNLVTRMQKCNAASSHVLDPKRSNMNSDKNKNNEACVELSAYAFGWMPKVETKGEKQYGSTNSPAERSS
jgi:hypothetical protein